MKIKKSSFNLNVSPSIGTVSAELIFPANASHILTLAHGAGANMHHVFMTSLAAALAEQGIGTLRFNFPFTEQNKRRPDTPAVAHATILSAIKEAVKLSDGLPVFASGKSFGGRMSSQLLALEKTLPVKGLIFYGFPLHPIGKPSTDRAMHLKDVKLPMLFLQGTKDKLAEIDLIKEVCASHKKATLIMLEGADHGFKAGKKDTISQLAGDTINWLSNKK